MEMQPQVHDHNHWSKWPHWAKGGSIGAGVSFIFIVFQLVFVPSLFYGICGKISCMTPFAKFTENVFTYSMTPLWSSPLADPMLNNQIIYVLGALAYYFVIGAFIGLMIEKRRKA